MSKKVYEIAFDFDGTIADSWTVAQKAYEKIGSQYGNHHLEDQKKLFTLRDLPSREALASLNIPFYRLPRFIKAMRHFVYQHHDEIKPVIGLPTVLKNLHENGYIMHIVSSNSEENIVPFLLRYRLASYVTIDAGNSLFGKHRALARLKKRCRKIEHKLIYIGDEVRDFESAQKAHIDFIGVTWGGNSRIAFERSHIAHVVDKPHALLHMIKERYY